MNKIVTSTVFDDPYEAYAELQAAAHDIGYDMIVTQDLNIVFDKHDEELPDIIATKLTNGNETYYHIELKFPNLSSGPDKFIDHIEGVTHQFYRVGIFATELVRFTYDPTVYED